MDVREKTHQQPVVCNDRLPRLGYLIHHPPESNRLAQVLQLFRFGLCAELCLRNRLQFRVLADGPGLMRCGVVRFGSVGCAVLRGATRFGEKRSYTEAGRRKPVTFVVSSCFAPVSRRPSDPFLAPLELHPLDHQGDRDYIELRVMWIAFCSSKQTRPTPTPTNAMVVSAKKRVTIVTALHC